MIEHIEPKAMADTIAVYCAHDKIVETDSLVGNPRNPNTHPKEQVEALAKIIKRQGWRHPIVVSNRSGFVVKGHGRLLAAAALGVSHVPVDYQDYESEASEYADLMADNKIQEFSELDAKLSAEILMDIKNSGDIELEMSAFTEDALEALLAESEKDTVKDDGFDLTAALENAAFVKRGDVWTVGRHKLMCGDATSADDVNTLMDGATANLILTDPPYGVSFKSSSGLTIQNDSIKDEDFYNFLLASFKNMADHLEKGGSAYVFHADTEGLNFRRAFVDAGFHLAGCCIWVKDSLVLGRSDYQWQHEPILYGFMQNGKHRWYSDRKQTTIWNYAKPKRNANHPTSKPLDLLSYPIGNSTQANSVVIDTFGGSGSTLMACEKMNRICYTMELDEKYASVILRRYVEDTEDSENVYVIRDGQKIHYSELVKEVVTE
nr:MAG TPA: adenine specific DNA methyltransferase [Caudoviricetes sp.]